MDGSKIAEPVEWGGAPIGVSTVWNGAATGGPIRNRLQEVGGSEEVKRV